MLMFNNKPLPAGVQMVSYTLWSPEMELRTIDIPAQRGLMRTGSKIGARSVRLDLVIESNSKWETTAIAEKLRAWCMSDGVAKLKLPSIPAYYLLAECEQYPPPDMSKPWEQFECSFKCFRPEFISETEYSQEVPSAALHIGGNVTTPLEMQFTAASDLTDPEWTIDDHVIALTGTVTAGVIRIDTSEEHAKITNNGDDITSQATLESDLAIMLAPGTHTVTAPTGLTGTAKWRNRYI